MYDIFQLMYPELKVFQRNINRSSEIVKALNTANERLQAAMETGLMGVWELNLNTVFLKWYLGLNPSAEKGNVYFEGTFSEYLSTIYPEDQKNAGSAINSLISRTRKTIHMQYRVCSGNGEIHWVETKGSATDGTAVGIWIDITKQKLNLMRTETQSQLGQLLIQNVSLTEAAPKILKILVKGLDWDKATFTTQGKILSAYPRNAVIPKEKEIQGTKISLPIILYGKQIAQINLQSHYNKIVTKEGKKVYQVIASQIAQFIQRVNSRMELAESKAQLETILQNVSEGIVVEDFQGTIVYANQTATRIMESLGGRDYTFTRAKDLFAKFKFYDWHGDKVKVAELPGKIALTTGKENSLVVRQQNTKTGTEKWLLIKSRPIKDSHNSFRMSITIVEDITEQIASQNQREMFLGVASHELKTPIMSIKAFGQLARRNHKDLYLDKIDEQANRLTRIVNEILDVNKIRAGKFEYQKRETDLIPLVRRSVSSIAPLFSQHNIELDLPPKALVNVDPERIAQAINNLVVNAVKYSPKANKVCVTIKLDHGNATLSVRDYGIGIAKKNLRYLFQSYYRARTDHTNMIDGLGLGLFITAAIVKGHQGKIWVKSREGKGSTFYISLPLLNHQRT